MMWAGLLVFAKCCIAIILIALMLVFTSLIIWALVKLFLVIADFIYDNLK